MINNIILLLMLSILLSCNSNKKFNCYESLRNDITDFEIMNFPISIQIDSFPISLKSEFDFKHNNFSYNSLHILNSEGFCYLTDTKNIDTLFYCPFYILDTVEVIQHETLEVIEEKLVQRVKKTTKKQFNRRLRLYNKVCSK